MNKKKLLLKQKKRIIALAAAFVLPTTSLTACGHHAQGLQYTTQENGDIVATGVLEYDKLKTAKLVHIKNEIAQIDKYYLVFQHTVHPRYGYVYDYYKDVETGKTVYHNQNDDFINFSIEIVVDHLVDYLYKYDMVKENYEIDEIKKLKDHLLSDETLFPTEQSNLSRNLETGTFSKKTY